MRKRFCPASINLTNPSTSSQSRFDLIETAVRNPQSITLIAQALFLFHHIGKNTPASAACIWASTAR